jgi:hypothetical protein
VTLWFARSSLPAAAAHSEVRVGWISSVAGLTAVFWGVQLFTAYVLAGCVGQEDRLVGTNAFWQTRPVANGRLLVAKLMATLLLLVGAPVIVLLPVWLASGFSPGEIAAAAGEVMGWHGAVVVLALAVASLTENIGQFFFSSVALFAAFAVCTAYYFTGRWVEPLELPLRHSRNILVQYLPLPGMAAILVLQYLTRRARLGWWLIGVGLAGLLTIRLAWPWDIEPQFRALSGGRRFRPEPADQQAEISLERIVQRPGTNLQAIVRVRGATGSSGLLVPESGAGSLSAAWLRPVERAFTPDGTWGDEAARQLAGVGPRQDTVAWTFVAEGTDRMAPGGSAASRPKWMSFRGDFTLARMRGRVLGELPLRAGAEMAAGAARGRVAAVTRREDGKLLVVLEEHEAHDFFLPVSPLSGTPAPGAYPEKHDRFLLVNRATGLVQNLPATETGRLSLNALQADIRELVITPPVQWRGGKSVEVPDWDKDATIVKVRLERDHLVAREIAAEQIPLTEPTQP